MQPQLHRLAGRARAGHRRGRLGRGALDVAPPLRFPLKPHATGARSARLEAVLGPGDRRVVDADASPERVDAVAQDTLFARRSEGAQGRKRWGSQWTTRGEPV